MTGTDLLALSCFFLLSFLTASSGGIFRPGPDYENLNHPSFCPPNYVFPIVWAILFCMISVSGWLIWRETGGKGAGFYALIVFGLQLVFNFLWSAIFFGLKWRGLALIDMGLLWLSIVVMIVLFYPLQTLAAYLLVPYLLWISFAALLNAAIWRLNLSEAERV